MLILQNIIMFSCKF